MKDKDVTWLASGCISHAGWHVNCKTAPSSFTQYARNPARSVEIGGNKTVFAPVYGPPFVRDLEGERRYAEMEDFKIS